MSAERMPGASRDPPSDDLLRCEQEPIHTPGAIQPHGAVLAAEADGRRRVTHASANLRAILGRPVGDVLGRPLEEAIGAAAFRMLQVDMQDLEPRDGVLLGQSHGLLAPDGVALHLSAHRTGRQICVDIEAILPTFPPDTPTTRMRPVLESFVRATTRAGLCELAVRGLKAITGYDRVMAYRFDEDGHGEVIAEAREAQLKPFLGQHYPASDIPAQARRQYLRQRVGVIADSSYEPVALLADRELDDGAPFDLTFSALRSVSPVHRQYMRNMGTAASLTMALAFGDKLWGMLVCHHQTPRVAGPELRAVAEMVSQVVSLLLGSLGEVETYANRLERAQTLRALVDQLGGPLPLLDALLGAQSELLHLVNAPGVVVRLSGVTRAMGRTPPPAAVERALPILHEAARGEALALDDLGLRHPELGDCIAAGSGALVLPIGRGGGDLIVWFRPEQVRTIVWGGDPADHATFDSISGQLCPRASFAAWTQTVNGRSIPWTPADLALSRDLRSIVEGEISQRTSAALSLLRHYHDLNDVLEHEACDRSRDLDAEVEARQRAEATLRQAQKMEAIGQLTGGVAHDFNNVLAAVLGNLELARRRVDDPAIQQLLANAKQAAERGAKLTDHLLSFARKQPLRRDPCDLNQLVLAFKGLLERSIGSRIDIRLSLANAVWTVMADPAQFEMALLNLAVNARDAMPDGGVLVIETLNVASGSPDLPSDLDVGDYVCVRMRDTGFGMTENVAAKVFEPFYTTKGVCKGSGLGLSQVYGFCKQLGGTAMVTTEVGVGTTVAFFLPRSAAAFAITPPPLKFAPPQLPMGDQTRGACILVIDDDPDVRDVNVEILGALGFDVVSADSGRRGLEILGDGLPVDLVVVDFSMPEMNGIEFIRRVNLAHPGLPCLMVTGYVDVNTLGEAWSGGADLLRKPYKIEDLAASVDRLLGKAGPRLGPAIPPAPAIH